MPASQVRCGVKDPKKKEEKTKEKEDLKAKELSTFLEVKVDVVSKIGGGVMRRGRIYVERRADCEKK